MAQTETENPHRQEAGIGWGTIIAGATAVMAFVAAFTGLSHLAEHNHLDVSQDHADNLSHIIKGQNSLDQLQEKAQDGINHAREKVQDGVDGTAHWTNDRLRDLQGIGKGSGEGVKELGKTVFGIGSPEEARQILKSAVEHIDADHFQKIQEIQKLSNSNAFSATILPDGEILVKNKLGAIIEILPEKLSSDNINIGEAIAQLPREELEYLQKTGSISVKSFLNGSDKILYLDNGDLLVRNGQQIFNIAPDKIDFDGSIAFDGISKNDINVNNKIIEFANGHEKSLLIDENTALLRTTKGEILQVDPEKAKAIDPRNFGGLGFNRWFDGQDPATLAELQKATAGKDVLGEIGKNAATAGVIAGGVGLALKASEPTNYATSIRENYRPVTRIDPNDAHIQLAFTARDINNAMAKV